MGKTKAILVRVTPEEHRAIKVRAAEAGVSMESLARGLLLDGPKQRKPEVMPEIATPARAMTYAEQLRLARGGN